MKTAILYSGHLRTFEKCLPTQHWHVFRHFPNADFFVSTIEDADSPKAELLRVKYPNARVEIEVVKEQPDCVAEMREKGVGMPELWQPPRGHPKHGGVAKRDIEYFYTHEPYAISVHPQAVLRQLWQLERCWQMFCARTPEAWANYDVIIRCRPDLWFHSVQFPPLNKRNLVYESTVFTPWWGRFGGLNDRFAIMGAETARRYFTTYSEIPDLATKAGCPIHPESLIAASLDKGSVGDGKLLAEFSTLRSNGEMRRWEQEVSYADLARMRV